MKPYPEYNLSAVEWAPALPVHWRSTRLRRVARIFAGGTPDRAKIDYWTNGTIPWLNSGSVNDGTITRPSALITEEAAAGGRTRWVPSQSVLIALAGQGKTKGIAARLEFDSTCNQSLAAIVPIKSLDYRFIQFWLNANYQNVRNLAGGDLRDGLNLQHINSISLPLPPSVDQRAIVSYLDFETAEIDAFIADQEQLIGLLNERRKSALQSVVESVSSAPKVRLRYLYRQSREANKAQLEVLSVYREFGVILKSSRTDNFNKTPEDVSRYLVVQPGYLVVNKMKAWQGSLGVSAHEGIVSPDYEVLIPISSNLLADYAHHMLRSPEFVANYAVRSVGIRPSQWRLYWDQMKDIAIPVPDVVTQHRFVDDLNHETNEIDAAIADAREAILLSSERRSAVIAAAVTGKIDVRDWVPSKQAQVIQGESVGVAQRN